MSMLSPRQMGRNPRALRFHVDTAAALRLGSGTPPQTLMSTEPDGAYVERSSYQTARAGQPVATSAPYASRKRQPTSTDSALPHAGPSRRGDSCPVSTSVVFMISCGKSGVAVDPAP